MRIRKHKPGQILRHFLPHQIEAYRYCQETQHPALLMQMRLGKTLVAIRWVQRHLKDEARTILVVAPITVLRSWQKELRMEGEAFVVAHGLSPKAREAALMQAFESKKRVWLLQNFESILASGERKERMVWGRKKVYRELPLIAQAPWDVVIVDESTRISNPRNQTTKMFLEGFRKAKHRCILTGLATPESQLQLWSQFAFLYGNFMGYYGYWRFRDEMFEPDDSGYKYVPRRGVARAIKQEVHAIAHVKQRAPMHVEKVPEPRWMEMPARLRELYDEAEREYAITLLDDTIETSYSLVVRGWLCKMVGGFSPDNALISATKITEALSLLEGELQGQKAVIWFAYRHELAEMDYQLKALDITTCQIHGGVPKWERDAALEAFSQKAGPRILLATEDCAKFGVDCSAADVAIYYSNSWSGEARAQSEDRIIHPHKNWSVLVLDLLFRDTIDEDRYLIVRNKTIRGHQFMQAFKDEFTRRYSSAHQEIKTLADELRSKRKPTAT